jgi:threonine synthase
LSTWKSTRTGVTATLAEALFQGPAPDGGLYVSAGPRRVDAAAIARRARSFQETAGRMAHALLGNEVPGALLDEVVAEALDFPVPLVPIGDGLHVLELFHGPTAAFKDVGARFMAALMDRLDPEPDRMRLVLVATSGDTGGAVADAFARLPRFRVVVLFPGEGVTDEQRRLFTTLGGNVTAASVSGSFDTCQALVKAAFRSGEAERLALTAANSINIGRLVPQSFYYVDAVRQGGWDEPCVFSVPSGNLGNITAGLMAAMAGLPVERLVASLNANDSFLRHLETGSAGRQETRKTLSSAMDVGDPSNLERISSLTGKSLQELRRWMWSASFDDDATVASMARCHRERGYLIDPHGAVGLLGAEAYREHARSAAPTVVLATAHPAKLPDVVEAATGVRPPVPASIARALLREERTVRLRGELPELLELLDEVAGGRVVAR